MRTGGKRPHCRRAIECPAIAREIKLAESAPGALGIRSKLKLLNIINQYLQRFLQNFLVPSEESRNIAMIIMSPWSKVGEVLK